MAAPIVIAEIDKYVSEKKDFIVSLLRGGSHSLLVSNTGSGKTTFCLEVAKENEYTVLLSPTRVIVDQMIAEAEKTNLKILAREEFDDWAFGEMQFENQSKIWIGTFAALRKFQPDWNKCTYVFIDEIHFLLDLSLFGKETALEVWYLTQHIQDYPNTKLVSMTASDELVLPLRQFFNFNKIFMVKSESWRLKPNKIRIYPTIAGLGNINYILHYAKNYVKEGEKMLCVVKSYQELKQLRQNIRYLPPDVEIANAQDKKDSETYWEICFNSQYPKRVRVFITTTWISLGASILDKDVKHVVCTFPNYSIVHQSLSRIRTGEVNVAVVQLSHATEMLDTNPDFERVASLIKVHEKEEKAFSEYFTVYKGEYLFFPLPQVSKIYQAQQENLFANLYELQSVLQNNLDCEVEILWAELLPYRGVELNKMEYLKLKAYAASLKFPIASDKAFQDALQLRIKG